MQVRAETPPRRTDPIPMHDSVIRLHSIVSRSRNRPTTAVDKGLAMLGDAPDQLYQFDAVGRRIWELIEKPASVESLCNVLAEEFEVDRPACERDVIWFLDQLRQKNLVDVADGPAD